MSANGEINTRILFMLGKSITQHTSYSYLESASWILSPKLHQNCGRLIEFCWNYSNFGVLFQKAFRCCPYLRWFCVSLLNIWDEPINKYPEKLQLTFSIRKKLLRCFRIFLPPIIFASSAPVILALLAVMCITTFCFCLTAFETTETRITLLFRIDLRISERPWLTDMVEHDNHAMSLHEHCLSFSQSELWLGTIDQPWIEPLVSSLRLRGAWQSSFIRSQSSSNCLVSESVTVLICWATSSNVTEILCLQPVLMMSPSFCPVKLRVSSSVSEVFTPSLKG